MTKGTGRLPASISIRPSRIPRTSTRVRFDDLRDLFAYLKTLPPVSGRVRNHELPFPYNIRRTLGLWKLLFLDGGPLPPDRSDRRSGTGRLSRQRRRPLRGMSLAAQRPRRGDRGLALHRRAEPGRPGRRSQHHPIQAEELVGGADIAVVLEDGMTPATPTGSAATWSRWCATPRS